MCQKYVIWNCLIFNVAAFHVRFLRVFAHFCISSSISFSTLWFLALLLVQGNTIPFLLIVKYWFSLFFYVWRFTILERWRSLITRLQSTSALKYSNGDWIRQYTSIVEFEQCDCSFGESYTYCAFFGWRRLPAADNGDWLSWLTAAYGDNFTWLTAVESGDWLMWLISANDWWLTHKRMLIHYKTWLMIGMSWLTFDHVLMKTLMVLTGINWLIMLVKWGDWSLVTDW